MVRYDYTTRDIVILSCLCIGLGVCIGGILQGNAANEIIGKLNTQLESTNNNGVVVVKSPITYIPTVTAKKEVIYYQTAQDKTPMSPEAVVDYMNEHLIKIRAEFNRRYNTTISLPYIAFTNRTENCIYQQPGNISMINISYYWQKTGEDRYYFWGRALDQSIDHEFCHHIQYELGGFPKGGESFCEVFANVSRNATECADTGIQGFYCSPYRVELLSDRQGFLDCVWSSMSNDLTTREMDGCFNTYKNETA